MISKRDYYVLSGLTTLGINSRKDANKFQDELEKYMKEIGVSDEDAYNLAGELVYNEGDDATAAVDRILDALGLEVEAE